MLLLRLVSSAEYIRELIEAKVSPLSDQSRACTTECFKAPRELHVRSDSLFKRPLFRMDKLGNKRAKDSNRRKGRVCFSRARLTNY